MTDFSTLASSAGTSARAISPEIAQAVDAELHL